MMKSRLPNVKKLISTGIIVSSALITVLYYVVHLNRRETHAAFRSRDDGALNGRGKPAFDGVVAAPRSDNWEYFKRLPKRLAANYYPKKDISAEILIKPFLAFQDPNSATSVTFLVNSGLKSFKRRDIIRKTWGGCSSFHGVNLNVLFIVGTNQLNQARLNSECRKYHDVVQVDVTDNASNRPRKLLAVFRWITTASPHRSTFYITTKDTCVVNIAATVQYLLGHFDEVKKSIHCGFMFENNTGVIRGHGPRSISHDLYSKRTYPAFCRSGLVILSPEYLKMIYEISAVTNITGFHLEDVLLYGILREKLDIPNSIKNVINGGRMLVYYPWVETEEAHRRMLQKWEMWKDEELDGPKQIPTVASRSTVDPK